MCLAEQTTANMSPAETGADQIRQLADGLYRERVLQARMMAPEDKLLAGEELFEYACSITLAGIRNQFPQASEAECRAMLAARLKLRERMERDGDRG